jgi:hypothetical protein
MEGPTLHTRLDHEADGDTAMTRRKGEITVVISSADGRITSCSSRSKGARPQEQ